jgi:hypothetical protein
MIRTVWLALICLISLAVMAAIKVGIESPASADAPDVVMPTEKGTEHASMKSGRLEVRMIGPVPSEPMKAPLAISSPQSAPKPAEPSFKIVSRHWHDPLAPKTEPLAKQRKSTKKASTR